MSRRQVLGTGGALALSPLLGGCDDPAEAVARDGAPEPRGEPWDDGTYWDDGTGWV